MTQTLVFDLDGTLADTARDLIPALNRVIARDGLDPVATHEIGSVVGHGAKAMIEKAFFLRGRAVKPARLETLFALYLEEYGANIANETVLFDGALSAMERFANAGWRLAICTNKPLAMTTLLLGKLSIAERFASVTGGDSFSFKKPDPRHLLETIREAGGRREHAVMVGDSITDISTGKAAGVPVVAVTFGYSDRPVETLGPARVISHFDGLWQAVASLDIGLKPRIVPERAP